MPPTRTRSEPFGPAATGDGLPRLSLSQEVETRAILKACIEARVALAALNMAARSISNQAILTRTLPILEACASAGVDDVMTTADRLFQYDEEDRERADSAINVAVRHWKAMRRGFDLLKEGPLTAAVAVDVCRELCGFELDIRNRPGAALTIHAGAPRYTPPQGEALIRELLSDWERYLHDETGIDPLIRMAVGHYQFEAIHPFNNGNGPTGRMLSLLYLIEQQLLELPILCVSRATIWNKATYYRRLNDVMQSAAWEPWILSLVNAVNETARWTTAKVMAVQDLLLDATRHVQRRAPSLYRPELVELVFVRPYCRINDVVEAGLAKRQTASVYLKKLSDIGILDEVKVGRDKLFIHTNLMDLLKSEQHARQSYN